MASCAHRKCGLHFSGVTAFDRHLRWHREAPWVSCRPPADAGLVWSESRQAWATHIGPLTGANTFQVRPATGRGIGPPRATCSEATGIGGAD